MSTQSPQEGRCNAKCRDGGYCESAQMPNGRCRMHGGASLSGPAHPNWKHGHHSKWGLTGRLARSIQDAVGNENLLDLAQDIAMLDARIGELLRHRDRGAGVALWGTAQGKFDEVFSALRREDYVAANNSMTELKAVIAEGASQMQTWKEVVGLEEQKRRLIDSQKRHAADLEVAANNAQLAIALERFVICVLRHVSDNKTRRAINAEFTRTTGVADLGDSE